MYRKRRRGIRKKNANSKAIVVKRKIRRKAVAATRKNDGSKMENAAVERDDNEGLVRARPSEKFNRKRKFVPPCSVCGAVFKNKCTLSLHLERYGDPTFPCEQCDTKFSNENQLETHISRAHASENLKKFKFKCPVCSQLIVSAKQLRHHAYHFHAGLEHMYAGIFDRSSETAKTAATADKRDDLKSCTSVLTNSVGTCSGQKYVKNPSSRLGNVSTETEEGISVDSATFDPFVCPVCRLSYKTLHALNAHVKVYANPTFTCKDCGTKFGDKLQLKYHMREAHDVALEKNKARRCFVCNQFIRVTKNMQAHLYHYHAGWEEKYPDSFSFESETSRTATATLIERIKKNAAEHSITASNQRKKTLIGVKKKKKTSKPVRVVDMVECPVCFLRFKDLGSLKNHTIHYPKNPKYPCKECGLKFSTERRAIYHNEQAHDWKFARKFLWKCPICNEFIIRRRQLQMHMYHHHEGWEERYPNLLDPGTDSDEPATEENSSTTFPGKTNYSAIIPSSEISETNISGIDKTVISGLEKSVTGAPASIRPMNFKNHNENERIGCDQTSRIEKQTTASTNGLTVPSEIISVEPNEIDVPSSNIETTKPREGNMDKKSLDESLLRASNNVVAAKNSKSMSNRDRESQLRALHSCEDCFVLLPRLKLKRKQRREDRSSINAGSRSLINNEPLSSTKAGSHYSHKLLPSAPRTDAPSIDLPTVDPNSRTILTPALGCAAPAGHPCSLCARTFSSERGRQVHIQNLHSTSPSIICNKTFASRQSLYRHYRDTHFKCVDDKTFCVCGMELVGKKATHRHFYRFSQDFVIVKDLPKSSENACEPLPAKFSCDKCGATFWLPTCLEHHRTLDCGSSRTAPTTETPARLRNRQPTFVRPNEVELCSCTVCGKTFRFPQQLSRHLKYFAIPGTHPCAICGTVFKAEKQLDAHLRSAHVEDSTNTYPIRCRVCNQGFNDAEFEHNHRMHFHPENIAEGGNTDSELDRHSITDSDGSDDELDKRCKVCDLEFSSGKRFVNHLIYYTKTEIIECNVCLEEFEGQYNAHHHNKLVHYRSGSRDALIHRCTICREGFMWKPQLHAHLCHVHGIASIEAQYMMNWSDSSRNDSRRCSFGSVVDTCQICDLDFASPVLLATHEIENLNEGEFVCNKCSRRCRTASILLDHLSLNHSDTAIMDGVKCRRCSENFQTIAAWVSHAKHFHSTKEPSEFYFEKNIASTEKIGRSLKSELAIPTNHSITSGMTASKVKTCLKDSPRSSAVIKIPRNASVQSFIKIEVSDSTTDSSRLEKINGFSPKKCWKCAVCALSFRGSAELTRHTALFSDSGQYMCELCGRRFDCLSVCQEHKKKHFRNDVDQFFCSTCNEGFETSQCKMSHEAHLHNDLHNKFAEEESSIDKKLQSVSPYDSRWSHRPILSAIGSSSQSDSADEPQSSCHTVSANDKKRLQREERSRSPRLHTEIFEDELSLSYQCPDCQEKFSTLDGLHRHLTAVHNMKKDPADKPEHSSGIEDSTICVVCDMNFANTELLNDHRTNVHSLQCFTLTKIDLIPVSAKNSPVEKKRCCPTTDQTCGSRKKMIIDVAEKEQAIITKPLLDGRLLLCEEDFAKSKNSSSTTIVTVTSSQIDPARPQTEDEDTSVTIERVCSDDTPKNIPTEDAAQNVCDFCDVLFTSNEELRVHQVKLHSWTVDGHQRNDDSSNDGSSGSSQSAIEQLNLLVNQLPTTEYLISSDMSIDFETVLMPETSHDTNKMASDSEKIVELSEPSESRSNSHVEDLSCSAKVFSILKVRPFARIIEISSKQTVPISEDTGENSEPPVKRGKQTCDSVVRQKCI